MTYDGRYLLILGFQALRPEHVREHIPCTALIFRYYADTLRLGLFRTLYQQLRRVQYELSPAIPPLQQFTRRWVWHSGLPYWRAPNGERLENHPEGYRRVWFWDQGRMRWENEHLIVNDTCSFAVLFRVPAA